MTTASTTTDPAGPAPDAPPARGVDFGHRALVVRWRRLSGRVRASIAVVSCVLLALAIVCASVGMTIGDYPIAAGDLVAALTGSGSRSARLVVVEWRLPVAIAAVVFGAMLGIGGAVFQSLTRNPLGSPDVIGFDAGAYTAVVVTILVLGSQGSWSLATAAILGGLATAFAVYVLAYRRGIQGFRLIVVGIGVAAMLGSVNAYLVTRAELEDAMTVGFWGAGSIARVTWASLAPALVVAAAIVVATILLAPALRRLELGDDAAVTHGGRPGPARLALIVVGVATVALVVAAAGPIGFIALVAPQLARRLTRSPGVSIVASAAMGALVLSAAHLLTLVVAQAYRPIPVGLVTVCGGGAYLIWLLVREARRHRGGIG